MYPYSEKRPRIKKPDIKDRPIPFSFYFLLVLLYLAICFGVGLYFGGYIKLLEWEF